MHRLIKAQLCSVLSPVQGEVQVACKAQPNIRRRRILDVGKEDSRCVGSCSRSGIGPRTQIR